MQTAQGYSLGAVDYILSPVVPDVLRSKVRVFVDLYQMQQRTRAMAGERVARARAEAARAAAEETTRRSNFLARASHELGSSLDLEQGMRRLLDLVVPEMADGAALVVDAEADRPLAVPQDRIRSKRCRITARCPSRCARRCSAWCAKDCRTRAMWCATRCATGERTLGALALTSDRSSPDLVTFQELAGRAAIALDNARLYQSLEREIVRSRAAEEQSAGREPAQGRVPRHAVARAAQPARADPQRGRGDPAPRAARSQADDGARRGRPPGQPAGAAGRGAARRVAHQPGQDRAQEGAGRALRASSRTAWRPRGR